MAAIFDLPHTPMSESVRTSSVVLADLENVGVAFGISLLSCIEAEMLCYFIRASGNMVAIFDLLVTSMSESVYTNPAVLLNPGNVRVAFGISLQSCAKAEIYVGYFRFSGRHLGCIISGYINQHMWEQKLLTYSLSFVLQVF